MLQGVVSALSPEQVLPLLAGLGESQTLVRVWFPPPHGNEQTEKFVQSDQTPSASKKIGGIQ